MPRCWSSAPRKKLPPPSTIASWVPVFTTSATWLAIAWTTSGSTPTRPPPNTSPDSLSSTRWNGEAGTSVSMSMWLGLLSARSRWSSVRSRRWSVGAHLEARELPDGDAGVVEHGLYRLLGVLHRRLLEQHGVLEEAVHPTLDDARQRLLRLALLTRGRLGDLALLGQDVLGHVVARHVPRAHRGDLLGRAPPRRRRRRRPRGRRWRVAGRSPCGADRS